MEYVQVPTQAGRTLVVEIDPSDEVVAATRLSDLTTSGLQTFEATIDSVRDAAELAISRMNELARQPEEITLQFAIQLAAEVGVVVAKSTASANMTMTVKWRCTESGS